MVACRPLVETWLLVDMVANILLADPPPPPPLTLGMGSVGQNLTFSGH